jgi:hypothetical protein
MEEIYRHTPKVLIDKSAGNNMMYLPLEKLLPKTSTRAAQTPIAVPLMPAPQTAGPEGN